MPRQMGRGSARPRRHKRSLGDQMQDPASHGVRELPHSKKRARMSDDDGDDLPNEGPIPASLSNLILREARAQQAEIDKEQRVHAGASIPEDPAHGVLGGGALRAALDRIAEESEEELGEDDALETESFCDIENVETAEEDERALTAFLAPGHQDYHQKTLADVILAKIKESQQKQGIGMLPSGKDEPVPAGLDDKVIEVYKRVGDFMRRYRGGKVPKAFKVIPSLKNWEDILFLTDVEGWSAHAVLVATTSFVSNLNEQMAQRFLNLVVLPKVREDIRANKRLHFTLYQSLKKACYKPGAFYKGIILPLCMSGTCNLREAVIFTSILKRVSLPAIHSAAALLRLADMPYSGTTSFFIRTLIDKKYALPYKVIDALVHHYLRFESEERQLPVVWHHSLLAFVQRYKNDIKHEDKTELKRLMKSQNHYLVTPEIHRDLDHAVRDRDSGSTRRADEMDIDSKVAWSAADNARNMAPVLIMEEY